MVLAGLVIVQFAKDLFNKPDYQIPQYYFDQFEDSQQKVNELLERSDNNRKQIYIIQDEIKLMDSLILNADSDQLDSLYADFFNSVR